MAHATLVKLECKLLCSRTGSTKLSYVPNQSEKMRKRGNRYWDLIYKRYFDPSLYKGPYKAWK
jgi:hypothetical protein